MVHWSMYILKRTASVSALCWNIDPLEADDMSVSRMLIGWPLLPVEQGAVADINRNRITVLKTLKMKKHSMKSTERGSSGHFSLFLTPDFTSALLCYDFDISVAGWRTSDSTNKSGPQTRCTTCFVHSFHLETDGFCRQTGLPRAASWQWLHYCWAINSNSRIITCMHSTCKGVSTVWQYLQFLKNKDLDNNMNQGGDVYVKTTDWTISLH